MFIMMDSLGAPLAVSADLQCAIGHGRSQRPQRPCNVHFLVQVKLTQVLQNTRIFGLTPDMY